MHQHNNTTVVSSPSSSTARLALSASLSLGLMGLLSASTAAQTNLTSPASSQVLPPGAAVPDALLAGGAPLGSPPRLLVSPTSDLDPANGLPGISDAGMAMVGGIDLPSAHFLDTHWLAVAGFVPTDVDGLARVPGSSPGSHASLAFSLLSNEGGVKDGDVVGLDGAGGLLTLVTEESLLAALGRDDADIDIDGIAYDDFGLLLFTLQSDLDATVVGEVEDGDVFRIEANGSLTRIMTEGEVQAQFTLATGSTAAIGDVNGLEWVLGELWVTTQGPSTWDGAVIGAGNTPIVLLDESQAGLGGAELNAMAFVRPGDEIASLSFDVEGSMEGGLVRADFVGQPNSSHLVLFAGATGVLNTPAAIGWGALYLDPSDAWLGTILADIGANVIRLDSAGRFSLDYTLPTTAFWGPGFGAEEGWSFQLLDLSSFELSAPVRLLRQ